MEVDPDYFECINIYEMSRLKYKGEHVSRLYSHFHIFSRTIAGMWSVCHVLQLFAEVFHIRRDHYIDLGYSGKISNIGPNYNSYYNLLLVTFMGIAKQMLNRNIIRAYLKNNSSDSTVFKN